MTILELIKEGLRIARSAKSLWLFGFIVGLGSSVNLGGKHHAPATPAPTHSALHALSGGTTALLLLGVLMLLLGAVFLYFLSQGALIAGVTRLRRSGVATLGAGWRDGLAHWGVLCRIDLIYVMTILASAIVLGIPCLLALKVSGTALAVTLAIPAVVLALPWLVTLYIWRAFAARSAVIENRFARDAIAKARLFLHGRLLHGLKLIIAAIVARLVVALVVGLGIAIAAGLLFVTFKFLGMTFAALPIIALGTVVLVPLFFILLAISGATQSSIWTIGYLSAEGK